MLKTIEFEYEGKFYEADVFVQQHTEPQYGADADGNRGVPRTFTNSIEVISVRDELGCKVALNSNVREVVIQNT